MRGTLPSLRFCLHGVVLKHGGIFTLTISREHSEPNVTVEEMALLLRIQKSRLRRPATLADIFRDFCGSLQPICFTLYIEDNNLVTNSMELSPFFEKLIVSQLAKKFPAICGPQRFITVFTGIHH